MKVRHFLSAVEHDRVHRAILAAEEGTSGRIVVYIGRRRVADALAEGHRLFRKLGLEREQARAGLLFFIAPRSRNFAVVGGTALHEKHGQAWWAHLARTLGDHFRESRYTEGLLAALAEAGRALRADFPAAGAAPGGADIVEE